MSPFAVAVLIRIVQCAYLKWIQIRHSNSLKAGREKSKDRQSIGASIARANRDDDEIKYSLAEDGIIYDFKQVMSDAYRTAYSTSPRPRTIIIELSASALLLGLSRNSRNHLRLIGVVVAAGEQQQEHDRQFFAKIRSKSS